jgi:hypothetical protein
MKSLLMLALTSTAALFAQAPKFTLKVHTGKGQIGYDVNSTMISGEIATYFPAASKAK